MMPHAAFRVTPRHADARSTPEGVRGFSFELGVAGWPIDTPSSPGATPGRSRIDKVTRRTDAIVAAEARQLAVRAKLAPLRCHGYAAVPSEEQQRQPVGARSAHHPPGTIRRRSQRGAQNPREPAYRASRHRLLRRPARLCSCRRAWIISSLPLDERNGHPARVAGRGDRHAVVGPRSYSGSRLTR